MVVGFVKDAFFCIDGKSWETSYPGVFIAFSENKFGNSWANCYLVIFLAIEYDCASEKMAVNPMRSSINGENMLAAFGLKRNIKNDSFEVVDTPERK